MTRIVLFITNVRNVQRKAQKRKRELATLVLNGGNNSFRSPIDGSRSIDVLDFGKVSLQFVQKRESLFLLFVLEATSFTSVNI